MGGRAASGEMGEVALIETMATLKKEISGHIHRPKH